ncbi:esterase-like activity of phytase family protein [Luteolibacter marinus]|uniref:esterase-like activity of phytase family protein n=1 Tax=Luteolibacter marinus TaxID=2776705 RepID=UPI0018672F80|nr:esterase-like activity of phytase family protein [Luteolibacter marinus]
MKYHPRNPWAARPLRYVTPLAALALTTSAGLAKEKNPSREAQGPGDRGQEMRSSYFQRIAAFPVFENSDIDNETVSEIVAASMDGKTLIYTDSALEQIGFIDISKPENPQAGGTFPVEGEPTSVGVAGRYALAAVVTDGTYTAPAGQLEVIDIDKRERVAVIDLGGQPDSVAISPDQRYAAVIIENERDEDLGEGEPGQPGNPPGRLVIVDLKGHPGKWTTRDVELTGLAELFPEDPEPEFVDINQANIAAVSMQENNHIVLVNLRSGKVIKHFPAGTIDLDGIDATEDDVIDQTGSLVAIPREPDAITWIDGWTLGTADEGDLYGGSRGFSFFSPNGGVTFSSGNSVDQRMARIGHYPEDRSENKGNEPEAIEYARFGPEKLVFVGSERSSVVSVYSLDASGEPVFKQVLPAGLGPEGLVAIPHRGLLVSASENDSRGDGFRAVVTIYRNGFDEPSYPTIVSTDRPDGSPIPWAAQSALAADPLHNGRGWSVEDSFYKKNRIFAMDVSTTPAVIDGEIRITDPNGVFLAAAEAAALDNPELDPAGLRNDDGTINIDPEGLARSEDGYFWLASEGSGTHGDAARPITSLNWIFKIDDSGVILDVIGLPADTNARQRRFGFEGVATVGSGSDEVLYACFQREWAVEDPSLGRDPAGLVRIGRYQVATGEWSFYYYPLDARESPNGGWVGLSEIVALGDDNFAVVERDNQAGPDARIKRIYRFTVAGLTPLAEAPLGTDPGFPVVSKEPVTDLMPALEAAKGLVIEKVEGFMVLPDGDAVIVTDNDGVDDSNGETQLIHLGELFE